MKRKSSTPVRNDALPVRGTGSVSKIQASELLAQPGQTLCFCRAIPVGEVRDAILKAATPSIAQIQRQCPAGTDCSSCHPEIQALIRELLGREPEP